MSKRGLVGSPVARCIAVLLALGLATTSLAADRPNVVLIMTDDQGIGDFGVMGNPVIETPNIDAMAGRSASISTFYVSPVCSPTRACLMTGRYNYRTRVIDTWLGRSMMEPDEVTIAEALAAAGYTTGIFGKWHLGDCYPMRPMDQGFEESLVHRGGGLAQPSEPRKNKQRYTDPILFHNGQQVQTKGYCTNVYFDAALDFIEQAHDAKRSFFAYIPTNAPHGPYHDVPEELREHYMQKDMAKIMIRKPVGARLDAAKDRLARIAAMITNVDQNVGRLFARLEKLGITDNTIVVFLVDNGPNTERYVGRYAGDLRGMKSHVHEGGVRSPLWMHWPARLKAGKTGEAVVAAHIDIMPTLLQACNVALPKNVKLDGRSFLPLLLNDENARWPDRSIVIQSHRGDAPVRYHHFMIRDGRWKLLHASGFGRERFPGKPKFELYDLANDPGEKNNLFDKQPKVVARLKKAYDAWFDDVSSTRPDNYAVPRIHVGTAHENPTVLTRQDWRGGTWAPNAIGHWEILIAKEGNYDIRLVFDAGDSMESAELRVGGKVRRVDVPAGTASCSITGVPLTVGQTKLEATLSRDGQKRGVYQVYVTRQ